MTPSRELRGVMEQILRHNPAISPGDPEIICGKTHGRPGFGYPCGRQTSTDAVSGVTVLSTDHDRRQTFDHRNHRCVYDWYPLILRHGIRRLWVADAVPGVSVGRNHAGSSKHSVTAGRIDRR